MISCTEFIPAYSELFKFLEQKGGKAAVVKFWEHLSDAFLTNLRDLVTQKGVAGCFEYWSHTLSEEAADFKMTKEKFPMRRLNRGFTLVELLVVIAIIDCWKEKT